MLRKMSVAIVFVVLYAGCGDSGDDAGTTSCQPACDDVCAELARCESGQPADCAARCTAGLRVLDCGGVRPAGQLTCDELDGVYRCADYCGVVCARSGECGGFDETLCLEGCAFDPAICNSRSVGVRTCDQIKPELRTYEDAARAHRDGDEYASFNGPGAFGLCTGRFDCEESGLCSLETNTCSACSTDEQCAAAWESPLYRCQAGRCEYR